MYKELINEIQVYLNKNPNEESLYDLFLAKREIEDQEMILNEIEQIRSSRLYEDRVIETIIQMLNTNDSDSTQISTFY